MRVSKYLSMTVVAVLSTFMVAGCQSMEDQISAQIGEQIAETAIEQATGGKMKVDVSGGDVKINTPEGEMQVSSGDDTVRIKGPDGEAVFGSGDTRPESVDSDLPNVEGANDFSWAGSNQGGMFSFVVQGIDHKEVCVKEIELLGNNGWKLKDDLMMEFEGMTTRTLEKEGYSLSVSCSAETEDNKVSVVIIKSVVSEQ